MYVRMYVHMHCMYVLMYVSVCMCVCMYALFVLSAGAQSYHLHPLCVMASSPTCWEGDWGPGTTAGMRYGGGYRLFRTTASSRPMEWTFLEHK